MARTGWYEAWGILLLAACILLVLAMVSYNPEDIRWLHEPPNTPPANFIGPVGAWVSFFLFMAFGVAGYLIPAVVAVVGFLLMLKREGRAWAKLAGMLVMLLAVLCVVELQPELWAGLRARLNVGSPGGVLGYWLATRFLVRLLGEVGTSILAVAMLLASLVYLLGIRPLVLARQAGAAAAALSHRLVARWMAEKDRQQALEQEEQDLLRRRRRLEETLTRELKKKAASTAEPASPVAPAATQRPIPFGQPKEEKVPAKTASRRAAKQAAAKAEAAAAAAPAAEGADAYVLPPLNLLDEVPPVRQREIKADFHTNAQLLKETLAEFGIEGEVTNVERGPVVTRYEVLPAPGVRVERIAALGNNIALAMKAETVRVQAPVPGKGVVGIEVPNTTTTMVYLREILQSEAWVNANMSLPLGLGKDVGGREIVSDLAEMPHLLVAGATGSGKTVCINSILAGLLMCRTPEQMRLMLVDPKIVEFSMYNQLPHLVVPVITDPKKVGHGLRWAIDEMEKRYKLFAKVGVRNIRSYNARPIAKQAELFEEEAHREEAERPPDRLPYIVIVVDELADLMLVAQAEVENYIARLAQLSRAVGIHMILATQRPSVNVITGTIKANFPARIAFKVAQKVDSRTILDANGADKLLGKGDMLFLPPGGHKLIRAQGTMTTDAEIRTVVEHIKNQGQPQYEVAIKEKLESKSVELPESEEDELLETAVEIIRQTRRASTSSLQRRLRIGYTRAARLMDLLEERGIVGPPRGSDPREILIDLDGEIPQNVPDHSNVS